MKIYLEDNEQTRMATIECNQAAQQRGFKDWWDWHNYEFKTWPEKTYKERESDQLLIEITNKYREVLNGI